MYMPNLTPRDAHKLWLNAYDNEEDLNPSIQSLSSYSAAYPGSLNMIPLRNSTQHGLSKVFLSANHIDATTSVENMINSQYLESFGRLGYNTLKPIGLNKTMKQLDEEKLEMEELQRNNNTVDFYGNEEEAGADANADADNDVDPLTGGSSLVGLISVVSELSNNNNSNSTHHTQLGNEQSFDMLLAENTRSNNTSGITNTSSTNDQFQFQNNEDFMAEDEEYQDDHSISMDSDTTTSRRIVRSNTRFNNTLPQQTFRRNISSSSTNEMSALRNEVHVVNSSFTNDFEI